MDSGSRRDTGNPGKSAENPQISYSREIGKFLDNALKNRQISGISAFFWQKSANFCDFWEHPADFWEISGNNRQISGKNRQISGKTANFWVMFKGPRKLISRERPSGTREMIFRERRCGIREKSLRDTTLQILAKSDLAQNLT